MELPCQSLRSTIRVAYIRANFRRNGGISNLQLDGGPPWIDSSNFVISAKASSAVGERELEGPLLQALLEDRFQLKTHRETRESQIYALTPVKSGLKMKPAAAGSCAPHDLSEPFVEPAAGAKPFCGMLTIGMSRRRVTLDLYSGTLIQFAQNLAGSVSRPVVDKTGINDKFDIHLTFAPENSDGVDDSTPSIFAALADLGLKLEAAIGPRDFLVIDSVQKPTEN
jgi:uncharacterized protein (TIGR03435 family)